MADDAVQQPMHPSRENARTSLEAFLRICTHIREQGAFDDEWKEMQSEMEFVKRFLNATLGILPNEAAFKKKKK